MGVVARNGRFVLLLGLLAGVALPGPARAVEAVIPELIAALLFLNAFRNGEGVLGQSGRGVLRASGVVLLLQLALPMAVLGLLLATGAGVGAFALAAILMMSAPSLVGAPNLVAMSGHDPAPAMRLLIVGTAAFPVTALVALWALPGVEGTEALRTTGRLALVILGIVGLGMAARRLVRGRADTAALETACDAGTAVLLAVMVVGLMAEASALLRTEPRVLAAWTLGVFALNIVLQGGALGLFRAVGVRGAVAASVVAGNRNIALYLTALPQDITREIMLFVGCYQVPMYLTPFLMARLHRGRAGKREKPG